MHRRSFLSLCVAAIPMIAMPAMAGTDAAYPDRPIQIVVPFAAGSASDVITRILLNRMATSLGQNFVVENRPGAGGNTGTAAVVHAAPDGYTLVMSTSGPLAANKALFKELGYDPQQDFAPICLFATLPNIVVINAKLPPKTLPELIDYAKQHPGQLNYGSVGVGSSQHLAGAYFEQLTGT
jgi:tripartite-type tricarboxylate transporter receptor subunit TctC